MGFVWDPKRVKRTAMDYFDKVDIKFFDSFSDFKNFHKGRVIAATARGGQNYRNFVFKEGDAILLGKESSGLPDFILNDTECINIPIKARSLNLSLSGAILLAKALEVVNVYNI